MVPILIEKKIKETPVFEVESISILYKSVADTYIVILQPALVH